ncbi:MAG: peptidase S9 [Chloroflexi bacterium RBG_13_51_18]|nr:MAG: peptidase S9 [Chloroflexi bacterium RBG_13_51_18]
MIVAFFATLFLAVFPFAENTQEEDQSLLTLDRLFSSPEFKGQVLYSLKWLKDGSAYMRLEDSNARPGEKDLVRYDVESGKRTMVISSEQVLLPGKLHPLRIDDYELSPNEQMILLLTNSQRVFHMTFGDYWIFDLAKNELWPIGGSSLPQTLTLATFSPDSKKVGYVSENNLFVEDLGTRQIIPLTSDGSEQVINGSFDYVYEEEFFIRNGYRWSPDSQTIAYWQLDSTAVPTFYMINNTDSLYPRLIPIKFPKPGERNSSCRIGFVGIRGGETRWLEVPGDPSNNYIPQMDWDGNSKELVFQHLNRAQNRNELMLGDVTTGQVRSILTDSDQTWVEAVPDICWLEGGQKFIWVSERDGWRHVYLASRSGDKMRLLTSGSFDVESIAGVDEKNGWLYYTASPENPTQRYLFRTALDGRGKTERVTPEGEEGTHVYWLSPCSRWAVYTYSRFGVPPVTNLVRLPEHKEIRALADNRQLREKVNYLKKGPAEFFRIDIGGVLLDAWSMRPLDFDPKKKYPVLFNVYGEPWGSTVTDRWEGDEYLWHLLLTQKGYIVMSVDNRGTRVPRGRAWRKSIYRQVGILASAEQAAAVRSIIRQFSFVDEERVGVWGWSGGGAMTLNLIFRYPDLYRTGMAVAPVTNQRFYNSIYQERYMGTPESNPEGYEKGSPVTFAGQLKGHLLVVHGTGDDNVHFQNTESLVNELVKHNKPFTMMTYPNRSHGIWEGENTTRHLYGLLTDYLIQNLPPGPRLP